MSSLPQDIDCRGKWGRRCDDIYPWVALLSPGVLLPFLYVLIREWVIWTQ